MGNNRAGMAVKGQTASLKQSPEERAIQQLYHEFKTYVLSNPKWIERTLIMDLKEYGVFPFRDRLSPLLNSIRVTGKVLKAPIEVFETGLGSKSNACHIVLSNEFWREIVISGIWKESNNRPAWRYSGLE